MMKQEIIYSTVWKKNHSVMLIKPCKRLKNVPDLIAVKAIYHSNCMSTFYSENPTQNIGRPASENTKGFIKFIINYITNNSNECQFS